MIAHGPTADTLPERSFADLAAKVTANGQRWTRVQPGRYTHNGELLIGITVPLRVTATSPLRSQTRPVASRQPRSDMTTRLPDGITEWVAAQRQTDFGFGRGRPADTLHCLSLDDDGRWCVGARSHEGVHWDGLGENWQ